MATEIRKRSEQKSSVSYGTQQVRSGNNIGRISREDIQRKAYELFQRRGGFPGQDLADWFEAERLLMGRQ
ncbi:MAG: DUF2934 domain-containing protein [Candidatus Omnitrophica bacterium]|nr:DUF2934 domain-containing protein [Candidatus Omnitrophota bacterium]